MQLIRTYFYTLAGIISALFGWNIGQIILSDLSRIFPALQGWKQMPEAVLFPCIAASLAFGLVLTEVFLSNPTRSRLNLRVGILPVSLAVGLGVLSGFLAGLLIQILFLPQLQIPPSIVRTIGWLFIGFFTGLAEGWTWQWRSIEAGDRSRFKRRLINSIVFSSLASITAALFFEGLRTIGLLGQNLYTWEDPVGFAILGAVLGIAFSVTSSPSYMAALRAGGGFEFTDSPSFAITPAIQKPFLRFVSDGDRDDIEEGLSIQLPGQGKISIGSASDCHIRLPGVSGQMAEIEILKREAVLTAGRQQQSNIEVNGEKLTSRSKSLRHNSVLTFYTTDPSKANEKSFFRFVYYNRFLDPQS
jgi:hypothetical protein